MKSTLLTSTALIAFAGVASAQDISGLSFTGDASLGYTNDSFVNDNDADNTRFFWEANLDVTMTTELDNGLTASALATFNIVDGTIGDTVTSADYILTLSGPNATLQFGDLDPVADDRFNVIDGNEVGFADQDTYFDLSYDAILIGESTFGAWTAAFSAGVNADAEGLIDDSRQEQIDGFQLFVTGTVSIVDIELAFQDNFFVLDDTDPTGISETDTTYGILLSTTVAGANLAASYIDDSDENSLGLSADYPVGPVVIGGYYTINDEAEDNYGVDANYATELVEVAAFYDVDGGEDGESDIDSYGVEGLYRVGDALEIYAGYLDGDDQDGTYYVAGEYDLGGGAEIIVSYADDGDNDANVEGDEIGAPEYNEGATVEVTFEF